MTFFKVIKFLVFIFFLCAVSPGINAQEVDKAIKVEKVRENKKDKKNAKKEVNEKSKKKKGEGNDTKEGKKSKSKKNNKEKKGKNEGEKEDKQVAEKNEEKKEKEEKIKTHNLKVTAGTNLITWANFAAINFEASVSFHNHFSAFGGVRYNPFEFKTKGSNPKDIFNKQLTGYAGVKYWPWFVNSGWWIGVKGQYCKFQTVGVVSSYYKEGVAVGGGISAGYTFMLGQHFNLDLGLGLWGGKLIEFTDYANEEAGPRMFFSLDNIIVSFIYVF